MRFKFFIESEDQIRSQLKDEYLRMAVDAYTDPASGKHDLHPQYLQHVEKQFATLPIPELQQKVKESIPFFQSEKRRFELERLDKQRAEESKKFNLETDRNEFERTSDTYGRIVCSNTDPQFEKVGMPMYPGLSNYDPELKDYYGVHCGSINWLPILLRDQYCDQRYAYVYKINTSPAFNSKMPFYVMEDFHIMDKTNTPGSDIIFSKRKVIPAKLVKLVKVIDTKTVKPAPDPY